MAPCLKAPSLSAPSGGNPNAMDLVEAGYATTIDSLSYPSLKRWAMKMNRSLLQQEAEIKMLRQKLAVAERKLNDANILPAVDKRVSFTGEECNAGQDIGNIGNDDDEELEKFVNRPVVDLYGDKGTYTGTVLKSTELFHGKGKMLYGNHRAYYGTWQNGRWHGYGKAKFANGDRYEGQYCNDKRHGHGKYTWADGRIYEGQFCEDRRHGQGVFMWPDGSLYEGEFVKGLREGHGTYTWNDGSRYSGGWCEGFFHGYGSRIWHDGRCYCGEWRKGVAHGQGIETNADGSVRHDGQWAHASPVRQQKGPSKRYSQNKSTLVEGGKAPLGRHD